MDIVYKLLSDDAPIRQGDIIKKKSRAGNTFGLIITADCDIAKRKHGNHYTWIEILPAKNYIESKWALEEIEKTKKKQSTAILEFVNKTLKAKGFSNLTEKILINWLVEVGVERFISKLSIGDCPEEIKNKIIGLHAISNQSNISPLEKIRFAAPLFKINIENLIEGARKHLVKGDDGFPDFFFLPSLPEELGGGCVALLRHIYSVQDEEIYTCEANAKIDDKPNSFYRLCRLSDRVKYSVVQKTTFLFSRIGMTSEFESLTATSAEQSANNIFEGNV